MSNESWRTPSCADDYDPDSLSVEAARHRLEDSISPLEKRENLDIRSALNRILANPVISPCHVPGHDNSAMDGYAVNARDLPEQQTASFKLIGASWAGKPFTQACHSGETVRIMTGAVMPDGCDTVIMQEHVQVQDNQTVLIGSGHKPAQNVRYAGEDIRQGDEVLPAGKWLSAADIGVLASLGIGEVSVYQRPRVAFFSTGDELCSIGEPLGQGQIYDSNRYTLFAMLKRLDMDVIDMGVIRDDPDALQAAFDEAASRADVIISSGGVSVGEADYTKAILDNLGTVRFWKIAMKPGRPLTYGKVGQAHFFGLPGNPVSTMVTFYQFVQPALQKLANIPINQPLTLQAACQSRLKKRPGRFEYQRGFYTQNLHGELSVAATGEQGSGILSSMSQANCFILLEVESDGCHPGDTVKIQPFSGLI